MLPPDGPFLEPALALLALPFRPVTAGDFTSSLSARRSASASCQAHVSDLRHSRRLVICEPLKAVENPGATSKVA